MNSHDPKLLAQAHAPLAIIGQGSSRKRVYSGMMATPFEEMPLSKMPKTPAFPDRWAAALIFICGVGTGMAMMVLAIARGR